MPMRVVSSELDPHKKDSDVCGSHTVLYPTNDDEVKEALVVAKVLGVQKVLVRSGRHATGNEPVDGTDAMVVNLRKHCGVEIDSNNNVTVCVGATTSDLADKLTENNLFLPLDGNPHKSVLSNVRSAEHGFVPAFNLRSFLTGSQGISKKNTEVVENLLNESGDTREDHIVTKLMFTAKTADDVRDYRMTRLCFTYDRTLFGDVLRHAFFGECKVTVDDEIDVRVTVLTGAYGMPMFTVTAVCPHESNYISEMLKRLDPGGDLIVNESSMFGGNKPMGKSSMRRHKVTMTTDIQEGVNIVDAVSQEGKGSQYRYEKHRTRFSGELTQDKLAAYLDAVHRAVGFNPTPILPGVKIVSTTSCKAQDGVDYVGVSVSLFAPLPKDQASAEKQLHHDFAEAVHERSQEERASRVDVAGQVAVGTLVGLDVGKNVDINIPNFTGEVYSEGMDGYDEKKTQYATTSYPDESERMTPYAIGYPVNTDDVEAFVTFAIGQGKKVVVRSGGHQYCGLSSGGSDTMLLSMDLLNTINVDDPLETGEVLAHAEPGAHLTLLAAAFKDKGVTIPHGECPEVCIGGHVQTGGFGHLLRSYGLALDYVKSFDIVLAHPVVELRTIERPIDPVGEDSSSDDRIFWGVMGGGAGSFGVITKIVFECIKDMDHPHSCGYQGVYGYSRSVFSGAMTVVQKRSQDVFNLEVLPSDCDLMVSVLSGNLSNPTHPAVVMVEMVHGNLNGLPLSGNDSDGGSSYNDDVGLVRMKQEIDDIAESHPEGALEPIVTFDPDSTTALSTMSNAFVRNVGMTDDGREFPYPYVKRMNCTTTALSDEFLEAFVDLVDKAMSTDYVKFVFQMGMGGGAYQGNADKGISSFPHRDVVMSIVFDLFYTNDEGKIAANELHNEFGALLPIFSNSEDIRMTWGSFGDIDMNNVHEEYYGSDNGLYESLQRLKQDVDPMDHFHTPFNVQLPVVLADGGGSGGRAAKRAKRKH